MSKRFGHVQKRKMVRQLQLHTKKIQLKGFWYFGRRLILPLDFGFSSILHILLIVRLTLNSEKVNLCSEDLAATCKLSDKRYATTIGELYARTTSIPYTKVISINCQTLSKNDTIWKTDVNNLSNRSLQGLLLVFLNKRDDFENKNEEFYDPGIKNVLTRINDMPNQIFAAKSIQM